MCVVKHDESEMCLRCDPREDVDAEEDGIERGWATPIKRSLVEEVSEVFVDKDADAGMRDIIKVVMVLGVETL
jgi:hypothetical protein